MKCITIPPPAELSEHIECYWVNTLHPGDVGCDYDYIIPDGVTDAIFMLNGVYERGVGEKSQLIDSCSLVPGFDKAVRVAQEPWTSCLAIRFRPGGFQGLTGISIRELSQPVYPLEEVMPDLADLVMNSISKNTQVEQILKEINTFLSGEQERIYGSNLSSRFIEEAIKNRGSIRISDFCDRAGLCKSTLEKNVREMTGLTPKTCARLIRIQFVIRELLSGTGLFSSVAYELDYHDQSHMIRDFKSVIGITPGEFLRSGFKLPNYSALPVNASAIA
ncbi:helix-turn-helix domain-containing protein [Rhodohalobacter mucosus]|uniref:HTH araC/xylS-type domain-containing protein n=1 Tax=Rhodohalobacter mucosus TaxID=2079485 RepID=A0A316TSP6_9BACT|nr:helix-turn-helix domain-containing protein [Rhodohalobacter mucosus]PWN05262.1 hypothetical protein DDZ15_14380 [Rhodohalobacter mucosus]